VPAGATGIVNYVETRLRDQSEVLDPKSGCIGSRASSPMGWAAR
jgi:hypothetical protein